MQSARQRRWCLCGRKPTQRTAAARSCCHQLGCHARGGSRMCSHVLPSALMCSQACGSGHGAACAAHAQHPAGGHPAWSQWGSSCAGSIGRWPISGGTQTSASCAARGTLARVLPRLLHHFILRLLNLGVLHLYVTQTFASRKQALRNSGRPGRNPNRPGPIQLPDAVPSCPKMEASLVPT